MKNLVVALLLILAAGTGAILVTARGDRGGSEAESSGSPLDENYDYYVQDMRATRFDSNGAAVSQLEAARVTHYPDGDYAELQAPAFHSFGTQNYAWQVNARAGTLSPDAERNEERLDLEGDVRLYQPRGEDNFMDLRTSMLTVFTESEEAVSSAPYTFHTRDSQFEGVGMRALLAENSVQLNDGNSTHDPRTLP